MPLGRGLTRLGSPIHEPQWLASLQSSFALHNVVGLRPELPFSVIRWDGERSLDWLDLGDPTQRLRPSHFEIYYCKESLRDEHYLEALLEASQSQSLVRKQLFGFWDLFYPLAIDRTQRIFLHVGQFYREPPDWKALSAQWRDLTGQDAVGTNPDFIHFARMA